MYMIWTNYFTFLKSEIKNILARVVRNSNDFNRLSIYYFLNYFIMKKTILSLEGVVILSRNEQNNVKGQMKWWCGRQSENLTDIRTGIEQPFEPGYQNAYGCWIYPGMEPLSHPGCGPKNAMYGIFHGQGVGC